MLVPRIIKARFHHRHFEFSSSQPLPAGWLGLFPACFVADRCIRPDELVETQPLPAAYCWPLLPSPGLQKTAMREERISWKMDPQGRAPGNNIACCGKFSKRAAVTHHPDGEYSVFALEQHFQIQPCNSPSLPFTKRKVSAEVSQLPLFWTSSLFAWTWSALLSQESWKMGKEKEESKFLLGRFTKPFVLLDWLQRLPTLTRKSFCSNS